MRENKNQIIRMIFAILSFIFFVAALSGLTSGDYIEPKPTAETTTELFATVTEVESFGDSNLAFVIHTDKYDNQIYVQLSQIKNVEALMEIQPGDTIVFRLKNEDVENFLDGNDTLSVVWLKCNDNMVIDFDSYYSTINMMNVLMKNFLTVVTVIMLIITLVLLFFIFKSGASSFSRLKKIKESQTTPLADSDIFSESDPFEDAETHVDGIPTATYKIDSERFKKVVSKFLLLSSIALIVVLGILFALTLGLTINDVIHHDSDTESFVVVGMLLFSLIYSIVAIFVSPKFIAKASGLDEGNQKNYCAEFGEKVVFKDLSDRTKQEIEYKQITHAYEVDDNIVLFTNFRQVIVVVASKLGSQQIDKIFNLIKSKNRYCRVKRQKNKNV